MADLIFMKYIETLFFIFFEIGKLTKFIFVFFYFKLVFTIYFLLINLFFILIINEIYIYIEIFFFSISSIFTFFDYFNIFYLVQTFNENDIYGKKNIIYTRSPIFANNNFFFFSKNSSIWENYWYINSKNTFILEKNFSIFRTISEINNFVFNAYSNNNHSSYFESIYKYKNSIFFNQPRPSYGYLLDTEKFFLKFPRRNVRFNFIDFLISSENSFSDFLFSKNTSKLSFLQNGSYSSNQNIYIDLFEKSSIDKWTFGYFKYLNDSLTLYYNFLNNTDKFMYYISRVQIAHLFKLNFKDIQFILKLIKEDPYFFDRNFLDVHWEIYSNIINFSDYKQISNLALTQNKFIFEINFFLDSNFFIYNKIFYKKIGFYNPFELIYSFSNINYKINKLFFISEKDLCILPFHILLTDKNHIFNGEFFTHDILNKSRINLFLNIFNNSNFFYSSKLFQYQQYFFYSKNNISNFLGNSCLKKIPYQHFDVSIHNPWWDSLSFNSKKKLISLIQNLSFEQLHLLSANLIDRYCNGIYFYNNEEIFSIIYNSKNLNIQDISRKNIFSFFSYVENILKFYFLFKKNLAYSSFFFLDTNFNFAKEYFIMSNGIVDKNFFNFFFNYSKNLFYDYYFFEKYKNISFFFFNIFQENNFFIIYDYKINIILEKNNLENYFNYIKFCKFIKFFYLEKYNYICFFQNKYENIISDYFFYFYSSI
jgi:hypothetical protein